MLVGVEFDAVRMRPADKNPWEQVDDWGGDPALPNGVLRLQKRDRGFYGPQRWDDRNDELF